MMNVAEILSELSGEDTIKILRMLEKKMELKKKDAGGCNCFVCKPVNHVYEFIKDYSLKPEVIADHDVFAKRITKGVDLEKNLWKTDIYFSISKKALKLEIEKYIQLTLGRNYLLRTLKTK